MVNTVASWPTPQAAEARVLGIQTKLHQWATTDAGRRFDDLWNLVCDPAFLLVGWQRVRANRGARSAGVDGDTVSYVERVRGVEEFLSAVRSDLKAGRFVPLPVRERMIPKPGGKRRRLGIATVRDRVVQAACKLVLEPIFEADFSPSSYGFRPGRRAQDAINEVQFYATRGYVWVLEGDITSCFDEIDHTALMGRVRDRVTDKRVLRLVKAFCKAGILTEQGVMQATQAGTPQGGILSPLLANIALSVLDEEFSWERQGSVVDRARRRRQGQATCRLVRYADDFVVLVHGAQTHVAAARSRAAAALAPVGLRLSPEKTRVCHIDEGFDFLGWRIQRHRKRGTAKWYVYAYPSRKAFAVIKAKVKALTRGGTHKSLERLCHELNPVVRGWVNYFRHGVSSRTFSYLANFLWHRVWIWLRRKHPRASWRWVRDRYLRQGWYRSGRVVLIHPGKIPVKRTYYRGARIPLPWPVSR